MARPSSDPGCNFSKDDEYGADCDEGPVTGHQFGTSCVPRSYSGHNALRLTTRAAIEDSSEESEWAFKMPKVIKVMRGRADSDQDLGICRILLCFLHAIRFDGILGSQKPPGKRRIWNR